MKIKYLSILIFSLITNLLLAQVLLNANGPGNTYEDINAILAPGNNVIEVPDCIHTSFGRHISEAFDSELNTNVFQFIAHKTPDNDRCKNTDRQRVEIKTYGASPDNLKAIQGETVEYKWKFKLPSDFKVSSSFTHIHQIKAVGGPYESIPMITLTARKGTPDRLELRYTPTNNQTTIQTASLDLFKGHWVTVTEVINFNNNGSYSITIKRVSNNAILLNYNNSTIDTWQDGASFKRPKWGIYRSLNNIDDLQDETVLFSNFSIEETDALSLADLKAQAEHIFLVPNPSNSIVTFKNARVGDYDAIYLYDSLGLKTPINKRLKKDNKLDVSDLSAGMYYLIFIKEKQLVKVLKCLVK